VLYRLSYEIGHLKKGRQEPLVSKAGQRYSYSIDLCKSKDKKNEKFVFSSLDLSRLAKTSAHSLYDCVH
jgi:hypothetical protein